MEPMSGLEPLTYALRKREASIDLSAGNDSAGTNLSPEILLRISQELAGKILIYLHVARSACYTGATQPGT